jgi:hypothetical protein
MLGDSPHFAGTLYHYRVQECSGRLPPDVNGEYDLALWGLPF